MEAESVGLKVHIRIESAGVYCAPRLVVGLLARLYV